MRLNQICFLFTLLLSVIPRAIANEGQICPWVEIWDDLNSGSAFAGIEKTDARRLRKLARSCGKGDLALDYKAAVSMKSRRTWALIGTILGTSAGFAATAYLWDPNLEGDQPATTVFPGLGGMVFFGVGLGWRNGIPKPDKLLKQTNHSFALGFKDFHNAADRIRRKAAAHKEGCFSESSTQLLERVEECRGLLVLLKSNDPTVRLVPHRGNLPWLEEFYEDIPTAEELVVRLRNEHDFLERKNTQLAFFDSLKADTGSCFKSAFDNPIIYNDYKFERATALFESLKACEAQKSEFAEYEKWSALNLDESGFDSNLHESILVDFRPESEHLNSLKNRSALVGKHASTVHMFELERTSCSRSFQKVNSTRVDATLPNSRTELDAELSSLITPCTNAFEYWKPPVPLERKSEVSSWLKRVKVWTTSRTKTFDKWEKKEAKRREEETRRRNAQSKRNKCDWEWRLADRSKEYCRHGRYLYLFLVYEWVGRTGCDPRPGWNGTPPKEEGPIGTVPTLRSGRDFNTEHCWREWDRECRPVASECR
jgi:hypothetical protein